MARASRGEVKTFQATIACGLMRGYDGEIIPFKEAEKVVQEFCNLNSLGVTITQTRFIYPNGAEPGFFVGVINYPRFPADEDTLREMTLSLARLMLQEFSQMRLTVIFPDKTVLVEKE